MARSIEAAAGNEASIVRRSILKHPYPETTTVRYIAVCDAVREVGREDLYTWVDYTIPSLRTPEGSPWETSWGLCPELARGGGGLTRSEAVKKDSRKLREFIAAVCGYSASQARSVISDARWEEVMADFESGKESPLAGRKFVCVVHQHINKLKAKTSYVTFEPYFDGQQPYEFKAAGPANATSGAKLAPPPIVKAGKPTFEAAMRAAGFEPHPDDADFVHDGNEVIPVTELRVRLGY